MGARTRPRRVVRLTPTAPCPPVGTPVPRDGAEAALTLLRAASPGPLVLLAVAVSNAGDLLERFGATGLDEAVTELGGRLVRSCGAALLRLSPMGGLVVALPSRSEDPAVVVARAEAVLRDFIDVAGRRAWPVVTLGVRTLAGGEPSLDVLHEARSALVAAEREAPGTSRWRAADTPVDHDRLSLVDDLADALRHDPEQLSLAYQPVIDLHSGQVAGAEALLRWVHPRRGPVSPLVAVTAAEQSGLVQDLGLHVLDRALAQLVAWGRPEPFTLHVNASPLQLRSPGFVDEVAGALDRHQLRSSALLLELTESTMMSDDAVVLTRLEALQDLGVCLGIDDFGTGHSSIARLRDVPVDTVKIDRSLVRDIGTSAPAFDLLRAVVGVLDTSGVAVVAEGVETALQAAHLRALGLRWAQGFHLGRPVPAAQLQL